MSFGVLLLVMTSLNARDPSFEKRVAAQYEAVQPGLGARVEAATRALDEDRLEEAASAFEQLTHDAPAVSCAFRRLSGLRSRQGRHDDAVALAQQAERLEPGNTNTLARAFALSARGESADLYAAQHLADTVSGSEKPGTDEWEFAKMLSCQMFGATNRPLEATHCGEALLLHAPQNPIANFFTITSAIENEDFNWRGSGSSAPAPPSAKRGTYASAN